MKTILYLARHGETEENVKNILQGHLPGHLTFKGIEQARKLRDQLSEIKFDVILASDLKRSMDTAMILNEPHRLVIEPCVLLRERDWGNLTGANILKARKHIDESAESAAKMYARAEEFLLSIVDCYKGKTVLAVGHGLFHRVIQGAFHGKSIREIPRMDNAEVRMLSIAPPFCFCYHPEESGATAY